DDGTRQITLAGNPILWTLALIAFLLALVAAGTRSERTRSEKREGFGPVTLPLVLIAGYLGNYAPFFLIERPMYLYHYFAALCFLFLALPWGLCAIDDLLARVMPSRAMRIGILGFVVCMVILVYLLLAPWVWGW
ncbi:MAG TPA: hypothetical protein VLB83_03165, partial [Candidatus Paceibacterota bacterium]|nr:hypothetical protein [Candidatus Paceibacterota bacterium]